MAPLPLPGAASATAMWLYTLTWCLVMIFVGPR